MNSKCIESWQIIDKLEPLLSGHPCGNGRWPLRICTGQSTLTFPGVYIRGQRIFVERVRNVFVVGKAFSI